MILCAGLGTRLLPITERFPKPIVPILNVPNLIHVLNLLEMNGIKEIILNLFHLPERIEEFIQDYKTNLSIQFSKESVLLGTGGGVKKAEPFFNRESFVLANCDFVANPPLKKIISNHFSNRAIATMVLFKDPDREKLYSKVGVDLEGKLCKLPKLETKPPSKTGIFTGIHILGPEIFSYLEEKPSGINEVLYPTLMRDFSDRVYGDFTDGFYWFDTGEISTIHFATLNLLDLLSNKKIGLDHLLNVKEIKKGVWIDPENSLSNHVEFRPPVLIGKGAMIEKNVVIGPHTVIGDHSSIASGSKLSRTILLNGSRVPANSNLEKVLFFESQALPA